tara:strand:- start:478 stop:591 length:114 start_codon:yes stop_codon:yes gene_type:complete
VVEVVVDVQVILEEVVEPEVIKLLVMAQVHYKEHRKV